MGRKLGLLIGGAVAAGLAAGLMNPWVPPFQREYLLALIVIAAFWAALSLLLLLGRSTASSETPGAERPRLGSDTLVLDSLVRIRLVLGVYSVNLGMPIGEELGKNPQRDGVLSMSSSYDVLTVGGGLAGAALAKALAENGLRVLVVEQTREFKDRVRGETMPPWGVSELRSLGLYDLLSGACGHEHSWFDIFLGPIQLMHRPVAATTPHAAPGFNFYHPLMQETVLQSAAQAGAEVRRGAIVREVRRGTTLLAAIEREGAVAEVSARLVVCADGRSSAGRRWSPQFDVKQDPPFLVISGVLLQNMSILEDTGSIYMNANLGQSAYTFPQGGGRVRAYLAYPVTSGFRLQGEKDLPRFVEQAIRAGAPARAFEDVKAAGPLASFDAADTWVECPYADGIVLIGDAASSNDPSWGQGLSLTLRDVRVLRDRLLATTDWDAACRDYAREHSRYYRVIHEVTLALKNMFQRPGPEADAWRARALPLIAQDPARVPDHVFSGPDLPWDEEVRRVFFAEEAAAARPA